jgi:hypothetical protein
MGLGFRVLGFRLLLEDYAEGVISLFSEVVRSPTEPEPRLGFRV